MDILPGNKKKWLQAGLSVLIVYHLVAVLVAPNFDTYVGKRLEPFIKPYLYSLELTNAWSFFAPNPSPPIFVEYELFDKKGESLRRARWPEETQNTFFLRERQNRRVSATDFMIASELKTEIMMVPYLCSREPAAHSLRLWRVMYSLPSMEEVASGKRKIGDDIGIDKKFVSHSFCEKKSGERHGSDAT